MLGADIQIYRYTKIEIYKYTNIYNLRIYKGVLGGPNIITKLGAGKFTGAPNRRGRGFGKSER